MLLALTLKITRLCNSHQLLLTQCLLSALRITQLCNSHQLLLTQCLLSALRITRLCNSHQLLLTQCLLSALRITHSCLANLVFLLPLLLLICKLPIFVYKESTNSHSFFFLFLMVRHRRDVSNLFYYILDHIYEVFLSNLLIGIIVFANGPGD